MSELERKEVNNEELNAVNGGANDSNNVGPFTIRVVGKVEEKAEKSYIRSSNQMGLDDPVSIMVFPQG